MRSTLRSRVIAPLLDPKVFSELGLRIPLGWIKALSLPRMEKTWFAPPFLLNSSCSVRWSSLSLGPKEPPGDAAIPGMHLSLVLLASGCIDCDLIRTLSMMSRRGDKLSVLVKPRVNILVEVYLLRLPCADSLRALTPRSESIRIEVVLDLFGSSPFFLLVVLFLKSEPSGPCDGLRTDAK